MSEDETYNGYKNYPTWNVSLWIDNDRAMQDEALWRVEAAMDEAEADQIEHPYWTEEQCLRFGVSAMLKTWIRDEVAPDLGASMPADLLGWAFDHVDWDELASLYIDQVVENATA